MNKKIYIVLLIALVLVFVCIPFTIRKNDKTTLTFHTLQMGTFSDYINSVISDFEKQNPDIKIKWIDVPYSEGEKRALAGILSDNPPDIINLNQDFAFVLAQKKALYFIPEEKLEQFIPSILSGVKIGNKYYAFPFYATSAITLYNTNFFKNHQPPKDYDELFNECEKFKNDEHLFLTMINFNENDTLLKIFNKLNITSPDDLKKESTKKLLNRLRYLYQNEYLPKESITQTHREALEKYMSGQIALLNAGGNFINIIKENAPSVYNSTETAAQLSSKQHKYDFSLMNFVIPKKSKHIDEAVRFVLFVTNKENQLKLTKMTSVLPANKYSINDDYFKNPREKNRETKIRILSAKQLQQAIEPIRIEKDRKEFLNQTSVFIQKILITNEPIDKLIDKYYEDWKHTQI